MREENECLSLGSDMLTRASMRAARAEMSLTITRSDVNVLSNEKENVLGYSTFLPQEMKLSQIGEINVFED